MFSKNMRIIEVRSVFFGHRLFAAGEKHDYSGGIRDYELIFKYSGISLITFGDRTFEESGGTVRFLPICDVACTYTTETRQPGDYCLFRFRAENAPDALQTMTLSPQMAAHVGALFQRLYHTHILQQPGYEHRCLSLAYEIAAELERESYVAPETYSRLEPALRYIADHLTEKIDCSSLHTLCGVSYTHFKNLFLRVYGVPPCRYITQLRMKLACEALGSGELSVSRVAEELGYTDTAYFSRQFRREIGCTAQEYRKKLTNGSS